MIFFNQSDRVALESSFNFEVALLSVDCTNGEILLANFLSVKKSLSISTVSCILVFNLPSGEA